LPTSATDLLSRAFAQCPTRRLQAFAFPPAGDLNSPCTSKPKHREGTIPDDAGGPLPATPALRGDTVDAVSTSCSQVHRPAFRRGAANAARLHGYVLGPHEPGELTTGVPPSLASYLPARPRAFLWAARQRRLVPGPGTPSTDRSRMPSEDSSPSATTRTATGTRVLPLRAQLPTCVHAPSVAR
jgi:hypothetical protein